MRVDVFQNIDPEATGREFVALLHVPGASVHIFGSSKIDVECRVSNFLAAEREKAAKAEATREALATRRKEKANAR